MLFKSRRNFKRSFPNQVRVVLDDAEKIHRHIYLRSFIIIIICIFMSDEDYKGVEILQKYKMNEERPLSI